MLCQINYYHTIVFLRALKMSTGENAIEESVIDLSSCLTNSFDLEISTLLSKFSIMGLPHITNILLSNTFINHRCHWNSTVIVLFNTFPERSHIFVHERFSMLICTNYFFVLSTLP